MQIGELRARLQEIGVPISEKTLRRWGKNGLIKDHELNLAGRGRGNKEEWHEQALEDAAAVWAISNCGIMKPRTLNKEILLGIKTIAHHVFQSSTVIQEVPEHLAVTTPNPESFYHFRSLKTKIVDNDALNDLAVVWIAAKAKVRNNEAAREEARRIKEREDAQSDKWKLERQKLEELGAVSRPRYVFFKIPDPAEVIVHWHSELLRSKNPLLKNTSVDQFERTLEKEGVFTDVPREGLRYVLERIPHIFRDAPKWFQTQECRIPSGAPTVRDFWNNHKDSWTPAERLYAINEITKDWRYLPVGWTFKYDSVELKPSSSDLDELSVFIDGKDSRKKAAYDPFRQYNKFDKYDCEHLGRFY